MHCSEFYRTTAPLSCMCIYLSCTYHQPSLPALVRCCELTTIEIHSVVRSIAFCSARTHVVSPMQPPRTCLAGAQALIVLCGQRPRMCSFPTPAVADGHWEHPRPQTPPHLPGLMDFVVRTHPTLSDAMCMPRQHQQVTGALNHR